MVKRSVIDVHLHAYLPYEQAPPNPKTGRPAAAANEKDLRRMTMDSIREYNIVKACLSGPLDAVRTWTRDDPDRFLVGPWFGPDCPLPSVEALRKEYEEGTLHLLGEIGAIYAGMTLADPYFEPYLALAEEFQIPVGVHTGIGPPGVHQVHPRFRITLGRPLHLEEVLVHHPGLRLWLCHAGFPYLAETLAILRLFPRVRVDVGAISWILPGRGLQAYMRELVEYGFTDRIMFGSDQMKWPEAIGPAVESVASAEFLSENEKRSILHDNAARFFRLEGKV